MSAPPEIPSSSRSSSSRWSRAACSSANPASAASAAARRPGALPATVQAVLAARIDRLGDSEKALLCMAAVIGRDVPEALLRELAGLDGPSFARVCSRLEEAELLLEVTPARSECCASSTR